MVSVREDISSRTSKMKLILKVAEINSWFQVIKKLNTNQIVQTLKHWRLVMVDITDNMILVIETIIDCMISVVEAITNNMI